MKEYPQARSTCPMTANAPPLGVREQPLRQARQERVGGDAPALPQPPGGRSRRAWCPSTVAGEVEGDQAEHTGVVADVVSGKVKVLKESTGARSGPGQSWHSSAPWCGSCRGSPFGKPMPWLAVNSRAGVSRPPRSLVSRVLVASSARIVSNRQSGRSRRARRQSGATKSSALRAVDPSPELLAPEENRPAARLQLAFLAGPRSRRSSVLVERVETQPADGVLHVELVLEA